METDSERRYDDADLRVCLRKVQKAVHFDPEDCRVRKEKLPLPEVQEQKGDAADRRLPNHHIKEKLKASPAPDDDLVPVKRESRRRGQTNGRRPQ
jgi:hypothetical protein